MKKAICALLVFVMISSMIPLSVSAAQNGDYTYTVLSNYAIITKYNGPDGIVTIPTKMDGYPVLTIGEFAFSGCTGLTEVNLPDGITSVSYASFLNCSSITKVNIGKSVFTINKNAFDGCTKLSQFVVDPNNGSLSSNDGVLFNKKQTNMVLYPIGKIGAYTIPNSVTEIGESQFQNLTTLTGITIGTGVTSIGSYAFDHCTGLTQLTIPKNVMSIGYNSFNACTGLTSVTISEGVKTIGSDAFDYCTSLTSVIIPNTVTAIGSNAFCFNLALTSVTIGDGVLILDDQFTGCTALINLTLGSGMTNIYFSNYYQYKNLQQINVSPKNTTFSSIDGVLCNSEKTKTVYYPLGKKGEYVIPEGITTIGLNTFQYNTQITSISIPNSVTGIEQGSFWGCSNLSSVTIGSGLTNIGVSSSSGEGNALLDCWALEEYIVDADNQTYSSQNGVLFNKAKTQIIACPPCKSGTYVIPDNVTDFGKAFFGNKKLTGITIGKGITTIEASAFNGCVSLTNVVIPYGVTKIKEWAFIRCRALEQITIPNSVTQIGNGAFSDCDSLSRMDIGMGVENINTLMFSNPSKISELYFYGNAPSANDDIFQAFSPSLTVYYISEKTGFTNPWKGKPTKAFTPEIVTPIGLSAVKVIGASVSCTWDDIMGASGYDVYNGTTKVNSTPILTPYYTINHLSPNTTYIITVKAVYTGIDSPASAELNVTTESRIPGDSNDDRVVDLKDVTMLSRYVAGWYEPIDIPLDPVYYDMDGDGVVDLKDVTLLSRFISSWDVTIS